MSLQTEIAKRARVWASEITKQAHTNLGKYRKLISVKSSVSADKDGRVIVVSTASNTATSEYGDVKNVARAYEYGSGIHGSKKSKYRIAPRRKKVLAFFWDKFDVDPNVQNQAVNSPKFVGFADDGRLMFRFVDHPGVKAANNGRGYMKPAVEKVRRQIRKELPPEIRKEVLGSFRRSFKKSR